MPIGHACLRYCQARPFIAGVGRSTHSGPTSRPSRHRRFFLVTGMDPDSMTSQLDCPNYLFSNHPTRSGSSAYCSNIRSGAITGHGCQSMRARRCFETAPMTTQLIGAAHFSRRRVPGRSSTRSGGAPNAPKRIWRNMVGLTGTLSTNPPSLALAATTESCFKSFPHPEKPGPWCPMPYQPPLLWHLSRH